MKQWGKRIGFGIVLWAVTYAASIPLLPLKETSPDGFKSLVISIASVLSAVITVIYFMGVKENYLRESFVVALAWLVVNWLLDFVALLPFTGQTLPQYFLEIGLSYIGFMAPVLAIGYLLDRKKMVE